MNLIPTPRGSGQGLYVTLLVGVELANTLRPNRLHLKHKGVYGGIRGNIPDLVYGSGVVV